MRYRLDKSKMKIRFLIGIFFVSATTLCLQISLTRFFSVSQQYHFAFLVVSIAFLGYGSAGSLLSVFEKLFEAEEKKFLSSMAILYSLTILGGFLVCQTVPFDFIKLSWDSTQIFLIFLYYVVLSIPFFFAGIILSFAITRAASMVNTLYFFDLLGAGTGTFIAIFIFLPKGDKGVFPILSILALIAAWLFSPKRPLGFKLIIYLLLAVTTGLFVTGPSWLAFPISDFKGLPVSLRYPEAKQLFTRWNAISRVDVIESPAVRYAPGLSLLYSQNLPEQLGLLVDGGELNAITRMEEPSDSSLMFLSYLPSSFPYFVLDQPRVLVLEPKGGLDVLAALHYGAIRVKIIENNPLTNHLIKQDLADFSGRIYQRKNVAVESSNTRSGLRGEKGLFDLVVFSLSDVFGSAGTGQFGFGENYLYTQESFQETLNLLSDNGIASMTLYLLPPPRQEIRLLSTWIKTLRNRTDTPDQHLVVLRTLGTISFFIKKSPYTVTDIQALKEFCEKCLFDLVYYPGIKPEEANIHNRYEEPIYHNITRQLLSPIDSRLFYQEYLFQVEPVSDNRPFFYNFFKLNKIKLTFNSLGQKWLAFLQGEFLVLLLLVQAIGLAFVLILLPVIFQRKKIISRNHKLGKIFLYFGLIGMSFMFVEITLIQKFILFLGHPLYSVAIILFSLLFSSGIGSLLSKKILGQNPRRSVIYPLLFAAVFILLFNLLAPLLFKIFLNLALLPKMLITCVVIFPLGFAMGFPFPTGIRLLEQTEVRIIPWAWATNAFSSVVNSVAALVIAFWGGFNSVLALAALGYLVAPFFLGFARHRNKNNS
jgi:hypothetical protein